MNGECRPKTKLRLRHMQRGPDCWEGEQGDRVQNKNCSERDGNFLLARIGDWGNRRNGAPATYGCAGRNEIRDSLPNPQESSQTPTKEQGNADASCGIDESGAAGLHNLLQVHSKSEPHHRCL